MRTLLVSANTETINMPTLPMGLGCVAATLEAAGHSIRFVDLMAAEDWQATLGTAIAVFQPEVIGISIRNIDDQVSAAPRFLLEKARDVVAFCRAGAPSVPIVLGGAGYSIFPQQVLGYTGADMGIQGEGEKPFALLLERLQAKACPADVPGLYLRRHGPQAPRTYVRDLDRLPLPGPELFGPGFAEDSAYYLPFQTRRGCPLDCSYCTTSIIEGHVIRKRSVAAVIDALRHWLAAGYKQVFFVDNVFNLPAGYALDLCEALARSGLAIKWRAILNPVKVSETLVRAMARAGCRDVALGFESGVPPILEALHKGFAPEDIRRCSRLLADHGIRRMGFLLLGGPGETRETVLQSLAFADSLNLDAVKLTLGLRIYPHTRLARLAAREGVLEPRADLLLPRFYLVPELARWLRETVKVWMADRPNWIH